MLNGSSPPLGIMPQSVAELKFMQFRIAELTGAIGRYSEAGQAVPDAWIQELNSTIHNYNECVK